MPLCRYRHPEYKVVPIADKHPIREVLASRMLFPSAVKEVSTTTVVLIWQDKYGIIPVAEIAEKIANAAKGWGVKASEITTGHTGREVHITLEKITKQ